MMAATTNIGRFGIRKNIRDVAGTLRFFLGTTHSAMESWPLTQAPFQFMVFIWMERIWVVANGSQT
jgi:hypothetical protein